MVHAQVKLRCLAEETGELRNAEPETAIALVRFISDKNQVRELVALGQVLHVVQAVSSF
jgi:hypothetical protein